MQRIVDPKPVDPKAVDPKKKKSAAAQLKSVWPMIGSWSVPGDGFLALSFLLLLIGRLCGLVLPAAPKYLLDDVIGKHRANLLLPLVLGVLGATLIQGLTSFSLTQLLSKEGQRLISELRKRVQTHVGRLSLNYYDANKTGALVSRIMSDVEGIRNLIGTGLVEFLWRHSYCRAVTGVPAEIQRKDDCDRHWLSGGP